MKIQDLHETGKLVSTNSVIKTDQWTGTAIQILKGSRLKEHITKSPALLICIEGHALFENEKGLKETLSQGNYVKIEPLVKHWIDAIENSHFLLIR